MSKIYPMPRLIETNRRSLIEVTIPKGIMFTRKCLLEKVNNKISQLFANLGTINKFNITSVRH